MNIDNEIEKKVSQIVDRYLKLETPIKNIKKYLTGKNIKIIIDELYDLEIIYLDTKKDKNNKDFKNLVKQKIIKTLMDRKYADMDKSESLFHLKTYKKFIKT